MCCSVDGAELIRLRQHLEDSQAHKDALSVDFISRMCSMTAEERVDADISAARADQRRQDTFHVYHKALRDFTRREINCYQNPGPTPPRCSRSVVYFTP